MSKKDRINIQKVEVDRASGTEEPGFLLMPISGSWLPDFTPSLPGPLIQEYHEESGPPAKR